MDVHLPADMEQQTRDDLIGTEKAFSQDLQRRGKWPHIWRLVGEYANFSILDVESNDELHRIISGLPLFPYMTVHVTPLATHPSDVNA
jgi:muconolactone D-isomerase